MGEDFPEEYLTIFEGRNIDTSGLEKRSGSRTFRWKGRYEGAMNEATTLETQLNILTEPPPVIPENFRDSQCVFLANTAPAVQVLLLEQLDGPRLIVADTMNYWIENTPQDLQNLLPKVNALVLNDAEARMFTGQHNLIAASREIVHMGLDFVVVKKGEHGTLLMTRNQECFVLPAYPTDAVKDPTGAGDSFAGGMMGFLDLQSDINLNTLKQAIAYGTVVASLVIEDFSLNRWKSAARVDIDKRINQLRNCITF